MESFIASLSKSLSLVFVIVVVLLGNCFTDFGSYAQLIPEEKVKPLRTISSKLNIQHWDVSQTSCRDGNLNSFGKSLSNVTCDCSFSNDTVCHDTNIQLKGLNLSGTLPVEFTNLSYLQEIKPVCPFLCRPNALILSEKTGRKENGCPCPLYHIEHLPEVYFIVQ